MQLKIISANDSILSTVVNGSLLSIEIMHTDHTTRLLVNGKEVLNSAKLFNNQTLSAINSILEKGPGAVTESVSSLQALTSGHLDGQAAEGGFATMSIPDYDFQWDNVWFVPQGWQGGTYIHYPHPDKSVDVYDITPYSDWSIFGNSLLHYQIDNGASTVLASGGPAAIGAAIGAYVMAKISGDPWATAAGALFGALLGFIIWYATGWVITDENGNIWFWVSIPFMNWLANWGWYLVFMDPNEAMAVLTVEFLYNSGYIRVGSVTFADVLGIGDPSPPPPPQDPYWVSSVVSTTAYGYGAVNNPNGLVGSTNDGNYVQLWGGNYNDGGNIISWMNDVAHGHIYIYGYSGTGYYTHLYTFVSYNNNNDWTQTSVQTVYGDGSGAHWIDCGSYGGNFRYIAFAAIDDNGMSANIFVDSVKVNP